MKRQVGVKATVAASVLAISVIASLTLADDAPQEMAVRYLLEAAKAFRTVYSKTIVEQAAKVGVKPSENWARSRTGLCCRPSL